MGQHDGSDASEVKPANDDAILKGLQQRLKPPRGGTLPSLELLAAAVALARDSEMLPETAYKDFNIPSGGVRRKRVLEYRDSILREGLLGVVHGSAPPDELFSSDSQT